MFQFRSLGIGIPSFVRNLVTTSPRGIDLPSVPIHAVEQDSEKKQGTARTLESFLRANHINHSVLYNNLRFHNHAPHILGSSYILGASKEQLNTIYDEENKSLEPWKDAPGEISEGDWRDYLGKKEYQRAYIDFFEDRLVDRGYDWKGLVGEYLFKGDGPLINNLIAGLAHPLIHLGYAYELDTKAVAIEALTLASCCYDSQHKYLDDPSYTKPGPQPTTDLLELLTRVTKDNRFDDNVPGETDTCDVLFEKPDKEALILEYWNSWQLDDPKKQFEDSQKAAATLLVGTTNSKDPQYNFYLVHVLTSSHAIRILLPLIPSKWHLSLIRQWWLFALTAYIVQSRPKIDPNRVENYDLRGRDWKYVDDRALNSKWATDAHYVKGCRALKVASETWGDPDQFFLKAGVRFAEEFNDWAFA